MLTLRKIAVTGGLASGKSTVCQLFQQLGAYAISSDDIVHMLLIPQTPLGQKVIALLGDDVLEGRCFNKKAIARKVFRDPRLLSGLEKILHPEVQKQIELIYQQVSTHALSSSLFVAEVPLLYEAHLSELFDGVIFVDTDPALSRKRFYQSASHDPEEYDLRSKRLLPCEEKRRRADFCITNNGSLEELKQTVSQLYNHITSTK